MGKSQVAPIECFQCPGQGADSSQIDVRDLAKLHIIALTTPGAANKRFVVGRPTLSNGVAKALRNGSQLGIADRIGEDNDEPGKVALPRMDISEVEEVFGFKWTPFEATIGDTAAALLQIEAKA